MNQQVEIIVKITSEVPINQTRAESIRIAEGQLATLSSLIRKPIELLAVKEEAELYGNDESLPPIHVHVTGGVVQSVDQIPQGVTVEIWDHDDEDKKAADISSYTGLPGMFEHRCEKTLREIAAIPLWADTFKPGPARDEAIKNGEYDAEEDHYTPSNDTETNHLSDAVTKARDLIYVIDKKLGR